jgi:antitoxin ParD1/3/4
LQEEVTSAYDAHKADPGRAKPLSEGLAEVRARIAKGEGRT